MNPHSIPNDRTIYVSKYAIGTTVEQLTSKFAQFGQVDQVLPNSNLKGMFVVFNSPDAVTKALSKDVDIKGVPLNVSQYLDIEKLDSEANVFIENIDSTVTQQSLKNLLSQYGQILSIKIQVSDRGGVAYIQFDKKQAADACIADQAKLGLKIAKYAHKKGKSHQIVRDQLYISDIKSTGTMEQLRQDLIAHFGEFGPVDSVQVNTNSKSGALYSFVKFQSQEHASKALKSNKAFQNQQLVAEWVVNGNDRDIEANLFTKNIKMSVTEEQLRAAYSQIVPLEDVRIIKSKPNATPKYKNAVATQKASLYLKSAEDGKKVIDQALRNPDVIALYEKGTVLLSPMLPLHELSSFYQMKKNETTMNYAQRFQHGQQYQQGYPQQGYPQQPYPYPQQGYPQQPYPQQGYPQQPHYPRQYRDNNYNNNNNYRPRQPRQSQMPSQQQLQIMLDKGQQKQVNEIVGSLLFPRVTQAVGQVQAPLITGILIDFENYSLGDQFKMLGDANYLNENIRQAGELLQQH